jgi:hypothetical protein
MLAAVTLSDELERIATLAAALAEEGERLAAVLAAEPDPSARVYLCAFERNGGERSWVALDAGGSVLDDRAAVRDAASIAAMCEVAAEVAGGGELEELRARLLAVRLQENPPGIDEAEEAALALERVLGASPRVASPAHLDEIGAATRRLEIALGTDAGSPFAEAMKYAIGAVESLADDVQRNYKLPLA